MKQILKKNINIQWTVKDYYITVNFKYIIGLCIETAILTNYTVYIYIFSYIHYIFTKLIYIPDQSIIDGKIKDSEAD